MGLLMAMVTATHQRVILIEDKNVTAGKYSYRLKQIDNDGQFEYSKTIEVDFGAPKKFELSQNYPNPFNPITTIRFNLPEAGNVKLTLFNILGQEIKTLVNEYKESGVHTINFDANELNQRNVYIQTRSRYILFKPAR
ncbi:MAG: T9SS type A sorting domain-containing protein [Ignavibacteriales bacterium]|nr:T9SS type A sorting domain-containing protein [Ignavibacteriales bacterium]